MKNIIHFKITKKALFCFLTFFAVIFTTSAFSYSSCVGGTEITANTVADGPASCNSVMCPSPAKKFCKSNLGMNWWSAFNWCKSNGGTLVPFEEACPGVPIRGNGTCPALAKSAGYVWTGTGVNDSLAFSINLNGGAISNYGRTSAYAALCK